MPPPATRIPGRSSEPDPRGLSVLGTFPPVAMMAAAGGGAVAAATGGRADPARPSPKATASIGIEVFRSDSKDLDFDTWIDMFERAVKLATNTEDDASYPLCLDWLPLKLDSTARAVYSQATSRTWPALKNELKSLFVDPQEAYKWQAKKTSLKWDGVESFHALAARVKSTVNRYEKDMPDAYKVREYFFRFRDALPEHYQDQIDMSCGPGERTLENAKDIAQRTQMTHRGAEATRNVSFAALEEDRVSGVELSLASLSTKFESLIMENKRLSEGNRRLNEEVETLRDRVRILEQRDGRQSERRYDGGGGQSGYRQSSRERPDCQNRRDNYGQGYRPNGYRSPVRGGSGYQNPRSQGGNWDRSPSRSPSYGRNSSGGGYSQGGNGNRNGGGYRNDGGRREGYGRDKNNGGGNNRNRGRSNYNAIETEEEFSPEECERDQEPEGDDVEDFCSLVADSLRATLKNRKGN